MAVKVKAQTNQEFKTFEIEVVDITWKKRCELNDLFIKINNNKKQNEIHPFSFWGDIVLKYTTLNEQKLNSYSTDEIIAIANTIFEHANAKKK